MKPKIKDKHTKIIFISTLSIITLFVIIFTSCNSEPRYTVEEIESIQSVENEKRYEIIVYTGKPKTITGLGIFAEEGNMTVQQVVKIVIENPNRNKINKKIYDKLIIEKYEAKKIISYTDTNIRFVDVNDIEQFISAMYIKINQVE